jgi:hypothetical protein
MGRHQLGRTFAPRDTQLLVDFLKTLTGEYHGRRLAEAPDISSGETTR